MTSEAAAEIATPVVIQHGLGVLFPISGIFKLQPLKFSLGVRLPFANV